MNVFWAVLRPVAAMLVTMTTVLITCLLQRWWGGHRVEWQDGKSRKARVD